MKLVGVTKIVSKKTGNVLAKCSFIDDTPCDNTLGVDVAFEFLPYSEQLVDFIDLDVEVIYTKGFNGKAYAQSLREV